MLFVPCIKLFFIKFKELNGGLCNHHKVKNCINPNSEGRLDVTWVSEEVDCALCLHLVYQESLW